MTWTALCVVVSALYLLLGLYCVRLALHAHRLHRMYRTWAEDPQRPGVRPQAERGAELQAVACWMSVVLLALLVLSAQRWLPSCWERALVEVAR